MTGFANLVSVFICWLGRGTGPECAQSEPAASGAASGAGDGQVGPAGHFGGGCSKTVPRRFGRGRVLPPYIPAAGTGSDHGTVFKFDRDDDVRRDPDRRGTNILPFQPPVPLERL